MIDRIRLAGFLKLELPGHTVLLCDGGTLPYGGDTYMSEDPLFGTIVSVEPITEGVGDEAPTGVITFAPQEDAAVEDICSEEMQGSRLRAWTGEIDDDTGTIIGLPEQIMDSVIDVPFLKLGLGKRLVEMTYVSRAERLFIVDTGNVLSGAFHKRIYPGERGFDNAAGVEDQFAWGVASAPRGTSSGGDGSGGGGGGGGGYSPNMIYS